MSITLRDFSWKFWSWHLYTKSMTLCVTWRFYIQNTDTPKKERQFALRFYIKKACVLTEKLTGALCSLTPPGQHSNSGGGEPTPPPFPLVWNFCPTRGTQSGAPGISNMLAQVWEEAKEDGCWVYVGTDGEVLLSVWDTSDSSSFIQLLGTKVVVLQQKLDSSGTEPTKGAGKVGITGESFE